MQKKYKKRKHAFPKLLAGLFLLSLAFVFTLRMLSDQGETNEPNTVEASRQDFIKELAPHAKQLQQGYGVLPSIILGQAILESNWGKSVLARQYKNLFGIKAFDGQKKVTLETQEYINEKWTTIQGDFRVYASWQDSMDDHTMLFVNGTNWNRGLYQGVLVAKNYTEAAQALQKSGYATDPEYAKKIIHVIETYQLAKYDDSK